MVTARRFSAFVEALAVAALLVVLSRPLIFGGSDRGVDFYTHYWFVWHQSDAIRHGGPSLYIQDLSAVYITHFAFYGGTLYVLTAILGILAGSVFHAYVLTFVLGFAAAYGGWWWLARQAGLGRLVSHVPGIAFVTSAYAMSLLYLRGDWPEHVTVGVIPLLAASGVSVLRADRLRPWPALALLVSSVVFFGSHNLTLLCGATVLVVVAALLLACVPEARRMVTRRGLLRVAALVLPALLVSAWFLVPDLVYQSHTRLGASKDQWRQFLHTYSSYVTTGHLFTLGRATADPAVPHFAFALPVLAMAWAVLAGIVARPRLRDPWLRVLLVLGVVAAALIVAMTHVGLLRGPFVLMQFSYRLESYINLMVSGAVLASLALLAGAPRRVAGAARWTLAPIAAVSIVLAVGQSVVHRDPATYQEWKDFPSFYTADAPPSMAGMSQRGQPVLADPRVARISFSPDTIRDSGRDHVSLPGPPGTYATTNIMGVWSLLDLEGARFVGVDPGGRAIIQRTGAPGSTAGIVSITAAHPPAVRIGRLITLLGLAGIAAVLVLIGRAGWRGRRRARHRAPAETRDLAPLR